MRTLKQTASEIKDKTLQSAFRRSWVELVRIGVYEGLNFRTANEIAFDILVRRHVVLDLPKGQLKIV